MKEYKVLLDSIDYTNNKSEIITAAVLRQTDGSKMHEVLNKVMKTFVHCYVTDLRGDLDGVHGINIDDRLSMIDDIVGDFVVKFKDSYGTYKLEEKDVINFINSNTKSENFHEWRDEILSRNIGRLCFELNQHLYANYIVALFSTRFNNIDVFYQIAEKFVENIDVEKDYKTTTQLLIAVLAELVSD